MTAPAKAENDAWFAHRATAHAKGKEANEDSFREGWRQGCRFTFGATSQLSPAIAAFIDWMQYVTDWAQPSNGETNSAPTSHSV